MFFSDWESILRFDFEVGFGNIPLIAFQIPPGAGFLLPSIDNEYSGWAMFKVSNTHGGRPHEFDGYWICWRSVLQAFSTLLFQHKLKVSSPQWQWVVESPLPKLPIYKFLLYQLLHKTSSQTCSKIDSTSKQPCKRIFAIPISRPASWLIWYLHYEDYPGSFPWGTGAS